MPKLTSFVEANEIYRENYREEGPIQVYLASDSSLAIREGETVLCVVQTYKFPICSLCVSNRSGAWEFHNIYRETRTTGLHSPTARIVDLEFSINGVETEHALRIDGKSFTIKEKGTSTFILDDQQEIVLKAVSSWRDSDRSKSLVARLWAYKLADPPMDIVFLALGVIFNRYLSRNENLARQAIW